MSEEQEIIEDVQKEIDYKALAEKLQHETELLKKDNKGKDKKITELSTDVKSVADRLKEIELAGKTEVEREKIEREELSKALKEKDNLVKQLERKSAIKDIAIETGLDLDLLQNLPGSDINEMKQHAEKLQKKIEAIANDLYKKQIAAADKKPLQTGEAVVKKDDSKLSGRQEWTQAFS